MDLLTVVARYLLAILMIAAGVVLIATALRAAVRPLERGRPQEPDPLAAPWRAVELNSSVMLLLGGALAAAIGARTPGVGLVVFAMVALPHAVVLFRSRRHVDAFAVGLAKGMAVVTLVLVVGAIVMPECRYGGCVPIVLVVGMVWAPAGALLLIALGLVFVVAQCRVLGSVALIRDSFPAASPARISYSDGLLTAGVCVIGVPVVALVLRIGVVAALTQGQGTPQQAMQQHATPEAPRIDASSLPVAATLWSLELDPPRDGASGVPRTPAIAPDGTIYVATRDGLAAVNPDGSLRWRRTDVRGRPAARGPARRATGLAIASLPARGRVSRPGHRPGRYDLRGHAR